MHIHSCSHTTGEGIQQSDAKMFSAIHFCGYRTHVTHKFVTFAGLTIPCICNNNVNTDSQLSDQKHNNMIGIIAIFG